MNSDLFIYNILFYGAIKFIFKVKPGLSPVTSKISGIGSISTDRQITGIGKETEKVGLVRPYCCGRDIAVSGRIGNIMVYS